MMVLVPSPRPLSPHPPPPWAGAGGGHAASGDGWLNYIYLMGGVPNVAHYARPHAGADPHTGLPGDLIASSSLFFPALLMRVC